MKSDILVHDIIKMEPCIFANEGWYVSVWHHLKRSHVSGHALIHHSSYAKTHCNTLQHSAMHCNTLQRTAAHCNTLQYDATRCNTLQCTATRCNTLQHTATHCNTLQHTAATHYNTLQHTASLATQLPSNTLTTLQHTAYLRLHSRWLWSRAL